jgi:quinol monooxygenase YgiN
MVKLNGDPERILAAKEKFMDPVAEAPFREHGHRSQIVARNNDSIVVLNVWENNEGRDLANADPKMQEARNQILAETGATPEFSNWEILYENVTTR